MRAVLVLAWLAGVVYAVHLWFDPQTLRGRWREFFGPP